MLFMMTKSINFVDVRCTNECRFVFSVPESENV